VAGELAYVDASAFVKLVVREHESAAMWDAVVGRPFTSSTLLEVEAVRAVRNRQPEDETTLRALLDNLELVEIGAEIRQTAGILPDPHLRSLDAIHLATALSLGERCGTVITYDDRLAAAAQAHGLPVTVPQP
jgi:uncharacterized protein